MQAAGTLGVAGAERAITLLETYSQVRVDLLALVNDGAELGDEEATQLNELRPLLWTQQQ